MDMLQKLINMTGNLKAVVQIRRGKRDNLGIIFHIAQ